MLALPVLEDVAMATLAAGPDRLRFDDFELDIRAGELRRLALSCACKANPYRYWRSC